MDHLSSSQMNLYLLCGLKYKYHYIDELPKPFKSSALVFGSALHSTLAWMHEQKLKGRKVTIKQLYDIFDSDWYAQTVEKEIRFKDGEQEMGLIATAKEFLGMYLEENNVKVKAFELPFRVPLIHPITRKNYGVHLEGFIDLVEIGDTIVEFKTSAQRMNENDVHNNLQLTAYTYAYQMVYQKLPRRLKLINFIKGRKPRISEIETSRDESSFNGFFYLVNSILKAIKSNIFVPRRGYWCKDCEYAHICPLQKEMQNAKPQVAASQYEKVS
jgi:putative RecB family exonuclease